MPCTRFEEQQDQHGPQPIVHRTTFSRALAGLRFSNQQDLHSFAAYHRQAHDHIHPLVVPQQAPAPIARQSGSNTDDVTEQIRISVQDTHIGHNDIGGNISDVLDSFEESILAFDNSQLQQGRQSQNRSVDPNHGNASEEPTPGQSGNLASLASTPSTSFSTITTSRIVGIQGSQQQTSSNLPQAGNLVVMSNNKSRDNRNRTRSQPKTTEASSTCETKKSESDWSTSENDWLVNDTTNKPNDEGRARKTSGRLSIISDGEQQEKTEEKHRDCPSPINDRASKRLTLVDDLSVCRLLKPQSSEIAKCTLSNGSSFSGHQESKEMSYNVNVKIQYVDFEQSYLYGYLCISHLTPTLPTLTTFFEGEIISENCPFQTRKWQATSDIDLAHWTRLDGFTQEYARFLATDSKSYYETLKNSDYIFMRWKERFLVPDHKIKDVEGASYAGFYYVSFNKRTSQIQGYYYHITESLEQFQSLALSLDDNERSTQAFEFR